MSLRLTQRVEWVLHSSSTPWLRIHKIAVGQVLMCLVMMKKTWNERGTWNSFGCNRNGKTHDGKVFTIQLMVPVMTYPGKQIRRLMSPLCCNGETQNLSPYSAILIVSRDFVSFVIMFKTDGWLIDNSGDSIDQNWPGLHIKVLCLVGFTWSPFYRSIGGKLGDMRLSIVNDFRMSHDPRHESRNIPN